MKLKLPILIIAAGLCLTGCGNGNNDLTSSVLELYQQYADHSENLTVAYVGDYECEGQVYNVLMFRAEDEEQWEWLKEEFGIVSIEDLSDLIDTNTACGHHGIIMQPIEIPDEIMTAGDEAIQAFLDSVAENLRKEILGDSATLAMAPILAQMDSLPEGELREKLDRQCDMENFSNLHGDTGFILNADIRQHTLWLFFYRNQEEQASLAKKLKIE